VYDGATPLYWASAPGLDTRANPALTPAAIVAQLTAGFSPAQRAGVVQVGDPGDIAGKCPQNFNGFSECFAAVVFNAFPLSAGLNGTSAGGASRTNTTSPAPGPANAVNYTLRADGGLYHIDVRGRSDYERRVLPLQRALDGAITRLAANASVPVPLEWPFTRETNAQQALYTRLSASVTCTAGTGEG
jgi:ATP-binding cassette subfamily A (ABC1) protein 3